MRTDDTIAAVSSAVGTGARMIVRTSGPRAFAIAQAIAADTLPAGRTQLSFTGIVLPATLYSFRAPRSATGDDVVEFHIPGNPMLARLLLDELIRRGARHAEPGEFTARAYFSGRINLSEAEGVAATIAAQSERELAAARQLLGGELARRLRPVIDSIAQMLGLVEVGIDFADEDVSFLSTADLLKHIGRARAALHLLLADSARFERLAYEPTVVLVGRPNAGKSTLLNALAGTLRAVVSAEAGTTRDALSAHVRLWRGIVRVIDIAGIGESDDSEISLKMQQAAKRVIESADVVLLVQDSTDTRSTPSLPREPALIVRSKSDLPEIGARSSANDELRVSATSGEGLEALRGRLDALCFGPTRDSGGTSTSPAGNGNTLALNARHVESVESALAALDRAAERIDAGAELIALELREALDALGRILGSVTPDDVLGRIFATFCIGK